MENNIKTRSGGQILVDQLMAQGVEHVFCVPGESYLAVLDALHDTDIQITVCRQEGGAAMMADAYGKLTGRPGICMVTRGPGVSNAFAGIHIARQDSTPLIVFVGQIETGMREREAFQEVDYRAVFGTQTKWTTEIDDASRIPELISRAFHVATSGRPGPVVIALPEDMLVQLREVADAPRVEAVESAPTQSQMDTLENLLSEAKNPLAILGGSRWSEDSVNAFARFAEKNQLPVAVQFRRQMLFPANHPCFAGDIGLGINPKLLKRFEQADTVLLVGGRMSEVPSQSYTALSIPVPKQKLVHVHPDSQELNRVYQAQLAINATPAEFTRALGKLSIKPGTGREDLVKQAHNDYLSWSDPATVSVPGKLQMPHIMQYLDSRLTPDTIMTNGAGNYATWLHRFHRFTQFGTQLAPTSGSMGYGLPAAVGAKRLLPDTPVVCFAGDGCFMMHGQEFATAVQYGLNIVVLIFDNGMYGTIRMHQEKHYPGRISATHLQNPDFAAYAFAFGGHGERVESNEEFGPAFERAVASGKPAILHCLVDPQAITPSATIDQIRAAALK
ncbi:thiamine pyrophosphate-binding protein [Advenella alkanexedens]|uniref:Thiamine pyrophosphate-binding protein n=1 Tax=Advenella alkanexedens TaxID=1481665 RepID=A0ABS6NL17_9BURK|nr:thiamine pyrophosphate-binding protein [Advenella alkanexedens]MBV4396322.1 thiamine pyrophosphate-binding protein [Advenella alkanexedens]